MTESTTTRSIERAFDILECFLDEQQEFTLKEIVALTKLSPSTVHRLIKALEKRKYLICNKNKKYKLGSMVAKLGFVTVGKMGLDFKMIARKHMIQLHKKYNESISLYVIDDDKRLCIDRIESTHDLRRVIDIGSTFPLEVGAAGRILLAYLDQASVDDMYIHVDISSQEYQKIREQGYIVSQGEREVGVSALAVPIFNFTKKVIATLSLSGPSIRLDKKILNEIAIDLKSISEKISKELGYTS
ncbi:IclR family transcriptional regulator [Sulfurospirillum arcachonense]|uniref:IclR family transcriptional regulator n=1 Tax=Sulfurospirillum arcachonense TaxID=57666 RepID=UPI000468D694|nr:IclR family transcriptional regulator [Sulfurospirillum arcachonense]